MTVLTLMALGNDRHWTAHLQRALAPRNEFDWRGVFTAQALPDMDAPRVLWLLDGDDSGIGSWPDAQPPRGKRIYFHREPTVANLREGIRNGASGCLRKDASPQTLLHAIGAVESGLFAVDAAMLARALAAERRSPAPVDDLSHLTERQREIVHWAALGLSNKQIGRRLGISPETVKSHLHQVFEREGVSGRVALLALYRPEGPLAPDAPGS